MSSTTTTLQRVVVVRVNQPAQARPVLLARGGSLQPHLITITEDFASNRESRSAPAAKIHQLRVQVSGPNLRKDGTLGRYQWSALFFPRRRPADALPHGDGPMPGWVADVVAEFYPEASPW